MIPKEFEQGNVLPPKGNCVWFWMRDFRTENITDAIALSMPLVRFSSPLRYSQYRPDANPVSIDAALATSIRSSKFPSKNGWASNQLSARVFSRFPHSFGPLKQAPIQFYHSSNPSIDRLINCTRCCRDIFRGKLKWIAKRYLATKRRQQESWQTRARMFQYTRNYWALDWLRIRTLAYNSMTSLRFHIYSRARSGVLGKTTSMKC